MLKLQLKGIYKLTNSKCSTVSLKIALWERKKKVHHIITQNVDQLHFKAGSTNVTDVSDVIDISRKLKVLM